MRYEFALGSVAIILLVVGIGFTWPPMFWAFLVVGPVVLLGLWDMTQSRHAILRNFPILGHGRYLMEFVRPEVMQYFIESNTDGRPFSREQRSAVYARAKGEVDTQPFGTQHDPYAVGYEFLTHSLAARAAAEAPRVRIGGPDCARPYDASLLNVSAMSYGSLSFAAVLALNGGAKDGGFAHNTGEGGISPYHLEPGGDLIWQIGTGYFGCRAPDGGFEPERFRDTVAPPQVRMVEIKLSQGAKPGHGGILPGKKVTPEIAAIRGVPVGQDCLSPPAHTAFGTPLQLVEFVARLRDLSGGLPVGIKLCFGRGEEFAALCEAMARTGSGPDYIAIDGGEGGTGAAPVEFSNAVGSPLTEGLVHAHNLLVGYGLRDGVRLIGGGKVITGFDVARTLALGADLCYSARAMMFALGCIQALRCNSNHCPTGVATQDRELIAGLDIVDKRERVARFHRSTLHSFMELLGAAGLERPSELTSGHILRRVSTSEVRSYQDLFEWLEPGQIRDGGELPPPYRRWVRGASAERWWRLSPPRRS